MESQENGRKKRGCGCGCGCLKKISNFITSSMENFFYRLGKLVGQSPWVTILVSVAFAGACASGLVVFTEETRGEKLWVPQESISIKHQEWVGDNFPSQSRAVRILFTASNVLTSEVLKEMLEIDKQLKAINNGTENSWEEICFRLGPTICFTSSLIELWSFNETVIDALTREDIINKVNQPLLKSPVTQRKIVLDGMLSVMTKNSSGAIVGAEVVSSTYFIKNQEEVVKGQKIDKIGEAWEQACGAILDSAKQSAAKILYYTRTSQREAVSNSIQGDVQLLSAGYMLIIVYVAVMLGRFTRLRLKAWLALIGVVCVGLAIGVSFGLSSAFGEFYGPVHSVLPFLLLGIGVDDMFVIVQAWNNLSPETHKANDVSERVGLALKHAGVSITITSITDFLAFLIGATTVLPALRSFCVYAGIGIIADFILQATFFTAWMAIDARRQDKSRDSCCCCIKLPESYTESECGRKDNLQVFFGKFVAPAILSLPGKLIVMIITAVLFGFNIYGTLMLEQNFDRASFLPSDSMSYRYTVASDKYFPVEGASTAVYTGKIDYFNEQENLHKIYDVALSDKYILQSSVNSWYEEYMDWAKKTKSRSYFNAGHNQITNKTHFYNWLKEYLQTAGRSYVGAVMYLPNSTDTTTIMASRIEMKHKDVGSTQIEVEAMEQFRKSIKDIPIDGEHFAFSLFYTRWETNKIIKEELYRNMGLALAAVFIVTLIVIANLWTCLMVLSCVAFTLVSVIGTCHFWGLYIDTISTICLVLAVGLTVDYASHIAHTFMVTPGTKEERAFLTLYNIGPAVWNGGFSTFLAFVLLASSDSFVFTVFFKIFFTVVLFGLFHGLCFLPVLLCSIGPAPYDAAVATASELKPAARSSPVEPIGHSDVAAHNENYELAFANGKQTGKPPLEKSQDSVGSVNQAFDIPALDYHDVDVNRIVKNAQVNGGFK